MKRFSELTSYEKAIELLRWVLVPVAAIVGVVLLGQLAVLVIPRPVAQLPGTPMAPSWDLQRFLLHRTFAVLAGLAFVLAGAMTAPRSRPIAV